MTPTARSLRASVAICCVTAALLAWQSGAAAAQQVDCENVTYNERIILKCTTIEADDGASPAPTPTATPTPEPSTDPTVPPVADEGEQSETDPGAADDQDDGDSETRDDDVTDEEAVVVDGDTDSLDEPTEDMTAVVEDEPDPAPDEPAQDDAMQGEDSNVDAGQSEPPDEDEDLDDEPVVDGRTTGAVGIAEAELSAGSGTLVLFAGSLVGFGVGAALFSAARRQRLAPLTD